MNEETKEKLSLELAALMKKYDVCISSEAESLDDSGLQHWLVFERIIKKPHQWPEYIPLFRCAEINSRGIED